MRIEWSTSTGTNILTCAGRDLTATDQEQLRQALKEAIAAKQQNIIVDLTSMVFRELKADAEALAALFTEIRDQLVKNEKRTALCVQVPEIWLALNHAQLTDLISIHSTVAAARESLDATGEAEVRRESAARERRAQQAMDSLLASASSGSEVQQNATLTQCGVKECVFFKNIQDAPHCTHQRPLYVNQRGRCPLFMLNWSESIHAEQPEQPVAKTEGQTKPGTGTVIPRKRDRQQVDSVIQELAHTDERSFLEERTSQQRKEERERAARGIVLRVPEPHEVERVGRTGRGAVSGGGSNKPLALRLGRPAGTGVEGEPVATPPQDPVRIPTGPLAGPPARSGKGRSRAKGHARANPKTGAEKRSSGSKPVVVQPGVSPNRERPAPTTVRPTERESPVLPPTGTPRREPIPTPETEPKVGNRNDRPARTVQRFIEAWNRKDWETEYACLAGPLRPYPLEAYARMREDAANRLRANKSCPVQVLDHVVEEIVSPTEARVVVLRSEHLQDRILRQYQQIYTLRFVQGKWEITAVREVPRYRPVAETPAARKDKNP